MIDDPAPPRRRHRPGRAAILLVTVTAIVVAVLLTWSVVRTAGPDSGPRPGVAASLGAPTTPPATPPTTPPPQPTEPIQPLRVVALGDSVPSGRGCPCPGYVADLGPALRARTHRAIEVRNDAVSGWQTSDVLAALGSQPIRADLASADLVAIQVGANDFDGSRLTDPSCFPAATSRCWAAALAALRSQLQQVIQLVHAVNAKPDLRIALLGYWNISVDGKVGRAHGSAFVRGSNELTTVVNATIEHAAGQTHSVYVDVYSTFKGADGSRDPTDDLLEDGDHPNAAGNALLRDAVVTALTHAGALAAWTAP